MISFLFPLALPEDKHENTSSEERAIGPYAVEVRETALET